MVALHVVHVALPPRACDGVHQVLLLALHDKQTEGRGESVGDLRRCLDRICKDAESSPEAARA
jgi:hypothetical protein